MNIALIGYGKMGKEIEKICIERGHTIGLIIDLDNQDDLNNEKLKDIDVAIEFTIPTSAVANFKRCFEAGVPVVAGTTGWLDELPAITEICDTQKKGFFYASNFSLGVNIFFAVNKYLAKLMNRADGYDAEMTEIHHTQKLDAPSGTAITLAEGLIENYAKKNEWELDKSSADDKLKIEALREGTVPGTHIIEYKSEIDDIYIKHEAHGRKGFAFGAVLAAEFMKDKCGVYTMDDMLDL